jgi:hypothetical protein
MPVTLHAKFAITGDRQTIPHGELASGIEAHWNNWLLADCIPHLYLRFLEDACLRAGITYTNCGQQQLPTILLKW